MPVNPIAVVLLAAALTALASTHAVSQGSSPACPAPGTPVAEPYPWYPALDLARIPFHTGAGPWGPRAAIAAPAPPFTTRTVRVTSAAEFALEARVPQTRITLAAQYIGPVVVLGDVSDLDIVVPPGHRVAQLTIGRVSPPSTTHRVRVRGTTPGAHSGGLIGRLTFGSMAAISDIIIDGVDLNGDDGNGGNLLWDFVRPAERVAVVNIRGHGVGPASLHPGGVNIVIAGNRIMSGARSREANGYPEAWGIRGGDRLVVYDNRIDGTRYHRVRLHPLPGPPQYAWVANNTFVEPHEARIFSVFALPGAPSNRFAGAWAVCNRVYAHSTCMSPSFDAMHANYAMLTSNVFFGSITQAFQSAQQAAHGPGRDYLTGNTFSAWQAPPAWQAPGDPTTTVPLPLVAGSRFNPGLKMQPCPPP